MKRYAIVRVDENCPNKLENLSAPCITSYKRFDCNNCRYGDTKEQLIRKVAQALLKEELEWYKNHIGFIPKNEIDEPLVRNLYENCFNQATKIVGFLGVE